MLISWWGLKHFKTLILFNKLSNEKSANFHGATGLNIGRVSTRRSVDKFHSAPADPLIQVGKCLRVQPEVCPGRQHECLPPVDRASSKFCSKSSKPIVIIHNSSPFYSFTVHVFQCISLFNIPWGYQIQLQSWNLCSPHRSVFLAQFHGFGCFSHVFPLTRLWKTTGLL